MPLKIAPYTRRLFPVQRSSEMCDALRTVEEGFWYRIGTNHRDLINDNHIEGFHNLSFLFAEGIWSRTLAFSTSSALTKSEKRLSFGTYREGARPKKVWIVCPPALIAATPVGARMAISFEQTLFRYLRKKVLPEPAFPVM